MKKTALFLATAATLGLCTVATSALAGGLVPLGGLPPTNSWGWGNGPSYYGDYVPSAYDSYVFAYQYPVYTGRQVTAVAVELSNSGSGTGASPGPASPGTAVIIRASIA